MVDKLEAHRMVVFLLREMDSDSLRRVVAELSSDYTEEQTSTMHAMNTAFMVARCCQPDDLRAR